jgi:hypothetical protein
MWLQNAGFVWVPFIALSAIAAWFGMNDIASARASFADQAVIFKRKHNWLMCWLYLGTEMHTRIVATRQDLAIFARVVWTCILSASPGRAWLTASLMAETALRRPRALRKAVTLALMHKHLYEYMRDTCKQLDRLARELRVRDDAPEAV